MFTYELARRLQATPLPDQAVLTANVVHPGMVSTSFGAEDPATVQRMLIPMLRHFI